jgi:hypothetical protein
MRYVFVFLVFLCARPAYAQLMISEIYPAPESGHEWVELYNDSSSAADLSSYTLKDATGKAIALPKILLQTGGYILATSSSVLNNSGDTLYLTYSPDGTQLIAEYSGTISSNESFIQCDGKWVLTMDITPGYVNPLCTEIENTPAHTVTSPVPTSSSTPITSKTNNASVDESAHPASTENSVAKPGQRPSPQLFSSKHKPVVLAQTTTISPTPSITEIPLVAGRSQRDIGLRFAAILFILSGVGYLIYRAVKTYRLAQQSKDQYNEQNVS